MLTLPTPSTYKHKTTTSTTLLTLPKPPNLSTTQAQHTTNKTNFSKAPSTNISPRVYTPNPAKKRTREYSTLPLSTTNIHTPTTTRTQYHKFPILSHYPPPPTGCKIKALRSKTNTYIKTPVRGDEPVFLVTGRREDVMQAKKEIMSAADHFTQIRVNRKTPNNVANAQRGDSKNDNTKSSNDGEKLKDNGKNKRDAKIEKTPLVKCLYDKGGHIDASSNGQRSDRLNNLDCGYFSNGGSLKSSDSSFDSMSLSPSANSSNVVPPTTSTTTATSPAIHTPATSSPAQCDVELKATHIWSKDYNLPDKSNYLFKSNTNNNSYNNSNNSSYNGNNNGNLCNNKNNRLNNKSNNTSSLLQQHQITKEVRVPFKVVGLVVGPKGATIKRIQESTHTYIVTPGRDRDPVFEIIGCPDNVQKAKKEIESYISLRTKSTYSDSSETSPSFCEAERGLVSSNGGVGGGIVGGTNVGVGGSGVSSGSGNGGVGGMYSGGEVLGVDGAYNFLYGSVDEKPDCKFDEFNGDNYFKLTEYNYQPFASLHSGSNIQNGVQSDIKSLANGTIFNKNLTNNLLFNADYPNNTPNNIEPSNYNNNNNKVFTSKLGDFISSSYGQIFNNAYINKNNNSNNLHNTPFDLNSTTISQFLSSFHSDSLDCYRNINALNTTTYNDNPNNHYKANTQPYYCANSSSVNECVKEI